MTTHKSENLVGLTFDKCKLTAKLGAGGMGSVYLAEHTGLNRQVALKILPADMSRDPEYVARFRREALTAARMEHANIVQVYDVGQHEGRPYIVMQYVDGESLSTIVENLGAMDPKDAAKVTAGILRGLHHAHEQGIVHRDVKPDNVLITKGDQPKLLDFGLATETEGNMQITKDGMVVGTPFYLSPEQARGKKGSPLSDIYATGVSLYYLLTGVRPFTGATALAVLNKHINEQPAPPLRHNPKIPRFLNDLVLKLMSKRPEDRYASAAHAAQALEDWLAGRQVRVALPWRSRLPALTRKQKLAAAAGGGALAALLLTLLVISLAGSAAPAPAPPPKVVESRRDPIPPADPARDADYVRAITEAEKALGDYSRWSNALDLFDAFLGLAKSPELLTEATRQRSEFVAKIRAVAEKEVARARKSDGDLLAQLRALDGFPKPMLAIDVLGDLRQAIRDDRERLLERLDLKFIEDEAALDRHLAADDFPAASALVQEMLRVIEVVPYARDRRLPRIQKVRDQEIPRRERDAVDRLVQAWEPTHAAIEKALAERDTPAAWDKAVQFLKAHKEPDLRARNMNYDMLMGIVPDPQLSDARLGNALLALGAAWTEAEDGLAYRILADLQDILDFQWLNRQIYAGLKRLSSGGPEVRLETLNAAGRIRLGPKAFELTLKAGPALPIITTQLRPNDLVLLAAAAEGQTPEKALEANASLVRATGVAWLYSKTNERWAKAETTLALAKRLGAPGPAFRQERLRGIGRAQAREILTAAFKLSAAGKFDDALKSLTALAASWSHDADLHAEIARSLAAVTAAEMRQAGVKRDWGRVKALGRSVFAVDEAQYRQEGFAVLFGHAVREAGPWLTQSHSLAGDTWTWDGRSGGTPAPAEEAKGSTDGLLLQSDRPLLYSPARAVGVSGFSVQFRIQGRSRSFETALLFDAGPEGRRKRLVFREPDEILLFDGPANKEVVVGAAKLEARLTPGRWFELGWASDGDSLAVYADQRTLFVRRGGVRPDSSLLGLVSSVPAHAKLLQVKR